MKTALSISQSERWNSKPLASAGVLEPQQRMKVSCGTGMR